MPKSKSRRKSRSHSPGPTPPKPKPSPRWLPAVGLGLIGLGLLIVLLNYLIAGLPGGNMNLVLGFVLMTAGLVVLSRWR